MKPLLPGDPCQTTSVTHGEYTTANRTSHMLVVSQSNSAHMRSQDPVPKIIYRERLRAKIKEQHLLGDPCVTTPATNGEDTTSRAQRISADQNPTPSLEPAAPPTRKRDSRYKIDRKVSTHRGHNSTLPPTLSRYPSIVPGSHRLGNTHVPVFAEANKRWKK